MPIDPNIPYNEIWFITDGAFRSAMSGYAIPPEQLPSEESKFIMTNDYGYSSRAQEDGLAMPSRIDENANILQDFGSKAEEAFREYNFASTDLNKVQSRYDDVANELRAAKERYQKAFFIMNEKLSELNEWLSTRVNRDSEGPK